MYKRLLVAVDGSEQSYKALDHAVAISEKFGSELVLLTVISIMIDTFFSNDEFSPPVCIKDFFKYQERENELYHDTLKYVDEMVSKKHPNLNIRTILREGRPSATIIDVAEKERCDMIVMGSRGIAGIISRFIGSTSHSVAASWKKPIMIIK